MKRLLITGSRDWTDEDAIRREFGRFTAEHGAEVTIVHGGAIGADSIADRVARYWGGGMVVEVHPADWRLGKIAGPARNRKMVEAGADLCLAFIQPCRKPECRRRRPHGSHGASGCADMAEQAGIPTRRITADGR